jgi:BirA family biotin operon repressor/biotin-[acetyl-CoA-carboxylase] ligase
VIGIGLNVRLPARATEAIIASGGLEPADLVGADLVPDRNRLAVAILDALVDAVLEYTAGGFGPFLEEWAAADALRDQPVRLLSQAGERIGVARGIDGSGLLRVETAGGIEHVASGDVSLRVAT